MAHAAPCRPILLGTVLLLAITFNNISTAAHGGDVAAAQPNHPQQQAIIVDHRPGDTCFNPPCPFTLYYDDTRVQGDPFHDSQGGDRAQDGHAYWADTRNARNVVYIDGGAIWRPFVQAPGQYRVSAFIPRVATGKYDTQCAQYSLRHADGESTVQINQRVNPERWVALGTFRFAGGASEWVDLNWNVDGVTCDGGQSTMLFDAMRFEPVGGPGEPVTVRAFLRDLAEGTTVATGTTVWHCFSISRAAPIRWWWWNPSNGWQAFAEWDDNGDGACRESNTLVEPGRRQIRIEALQAGQVVAQHETHFFVADATVPTQSPTAPTPTGVPSSTATRPNPSPSATLRPSVSVWIDSGCDREQTIGQTIRVGVQADAAGLARLSFEPQGVEFAVRSLRADQPETVDAVVLGPPGSQSVVARLEQRSQVVATASCNFRAMGAATATPTLLAPPLRHPAFLPLVLRATHLRLEASPTPTRVATSRATATPTRTPAQPPSATATPSGACFSPTVVTADSLLEVRVGEPFIVHASFRNAGTCVWQPATHSSWIRLSSNELGSLTPLPHDVHPGETIDLALLVNAPLVAGRITAASTIAAGRRSANQAETAVLVLASSALPLPARAPISVSNAPALQELRRLSVNLTWLETVDISPGGGFIGVGGGGSRPGVQVFEVEYGTAAPLLLLPSTVHSLELAVDSHLYASTSDGSVSRWEWSSGQQRWRLEGSGNDLAVRPDRGRLVSGDALWDISAVGPENRHPLGVHGIARPGGYSRHGLIGLYSEGIVLYDEATIASLWATSLPTTPGWFSFVSFSDDGRLVATSDSSGATHVWSARTGDKVMTAAGRGLTFGASLSPAGDLVATAFQSGLVEVRAVSDGRLLRTIDASGGSDGARAVQFSPDGTLLVIAYDGQVTNRPLLRILGVPR